MVTVLTECSVGRGVDVDGGKKRKPCPLESEGHPSGAGEEIECGSPRDDGCNLIGKEWGNGIADLDESGPAFAEEAVRIRKRLQPGRLPHSDETG